ncbi:hypothetical protein AVM47_033635 [Pseudomonas aeruginosa]|jgi:hypothetical protein|uniref:hypothetical protein n=1 Tax=Pseudomonas aeruginosa TaxID=287 RepID=UPI00076DD07C|nr:hypothetical protein [Pseudomonas aeruginosa]MBK1802844.1 hypothetical protein [Pseudomonas aeruginosa]MBM2530460.1 hypothetical protein [Pseudomonas aeruginosa]MCA6854773.1 hypothetical protein [Pseudomonas aeruginosa]MCX2515805.1 hypothetical protein [Pseudomonas aeruginosa]HCI1729302.1 hypothetical protein [Pseudomonas aeruginosa]
MEPTQLHAGDSVAWERDVPEYPASAGWSLRYVLSGPDRHVIEAQAGAPYRVEIAAETTASWAPGLYRWVALAIKAGQRLTLDSGTLEIGANLETAEPSDARSHAQRMLALIEAALEKRIPKDQQSYEIDGMRLDRIPIERLDALRSKYRRELQREKNRRWPTGRVVKLSMG